MADPGVILEMRDISKSFPGVKALQNVTFTVKRGEVHAICGENGAGKSTLMKVLSGVWPHGTYEGDIYYNGELSAFKDIRASESAGIVIIHQELALIPELSIAENMFIGNEQAKSGVIDWVSTNNKARELLARVGLREDPETPIKNIGVGKQQLVEIAKALNKDVQLLILDEPTAALNEEDSRHLLDLIRGLRSKGITCVIISHKLNEIEAIANSITIIRDGQTVETLDVDAGGVNEDRIIKGMVGRSLESRFPDHTPKIGEKFFEISGWTVQHPQVPDRLVCKNSSFFVRQGEIVGFAGLMGAGRTELMRSIFGHSYGNFVSGSMVLDGKPVKLDSVSKAIEAGIGYVTEDRKVLGLNLLDSVKTTTVSAELTKIASRLRVVDRHAEFVAAEDYRKQLRTRRRRWSMASPNSPAATSRRSSSRSGSSPIPSCSSSMNPLAASMSARNTRSTASFSASRSPGRASLSSPPNCPSCSASPIGSTRSAKAPSPAASTSARPTRNH